MVEKVGRKGMRYLFDLRQRLKTVKKHENQKAT